MPTYGYRCPACGHEFDKFQKISDMTRAECPKCGMLGERLISGGAGVVFKGSGFYETDYKRKKAAPGDTDKKKDTTPTKKDAPSKKSDAGTTKPSGDGS
jgi:putative FmdB family regulatory protein